MTEARDPKGVILVFLAGVLWSTVGLGIRLIEDAQVWQILFYRSIALTCLLYGVIRWRSGQNPFLLAWATGWAGFIGGLSLVAAYTGAIYALQNTSVADAVLLFASAPFITAILGLVILKERLRKFTWFAIFIAMAGIYVMVRDKTGETALAGNLAAFASAVGFAIFTITLRWGKTRNMLPAVFVSGILGITLMGVLCIVTGVGFVISPWDGSVALTMGVFQVGLGLVLYTLGSSTVPAAELTLISLAEVILAPVWVWVVLGETTSPNTLIGGTILLVAIASNALMGIRRKPPRVLP